MNCAHRAAAPENGSSLSGNLGENLPQSTPQKTVDSTHQQQCSALETRSNVSLISTRPSCEGELRWHLHNVGSGVMRAPRRPRFHAPYLRTSSCRRRLLLPTTAQSMDSTNNLFDEHRNLIRQHVMEVDQTDPGDDHVHRVLRDFAAKLKM